jgi:hypothetical protein
VIVVTAVTYVIKYLPWITLSANLASIVMHFFMVIFMQNTEGKLESQETIEWDITIRKGISDIFIISTLVGVATILLGFDIRVPVALLFLIEFIVLSLRVLMELFKALFIRIM